MEEKRCVKCGRPAAADQAFCPECLEEAEKYPVKPGMVVLLPRHDQTTKTPARRRHPAVAPEEQLQRLKKHVITLWLALVLTLSAAGVLGWLVVDDYLEEKAGNFLPGQNYSAETTAGDEQN